MTALWSRRASPAVDCAASPRGNNQQRGDVMRRLFGWAVVTALAGFVLSFGTMPTSAQGEHGIGMSKGCDTPTKIGDLYTCRYTIRNNSDDFGDDLKVTSLVDTVNAFDGPQTSSNI